MYEGLKECSPGLNYADKTCGKLGYNGWCWNKNGSISLNEEWAEKLRIVKELPFTLQKLPSDYQWAGGYPQFRKPLTGDQFLGLWGNGDFDGRIHSAGSVDSIFGGRRLIVEKIPSSREQEMRLSPQMIKRDQIPFTGPGKYELFNGQIVNLCELRNCLSSDKIKSKSGLVSSWLWERDGTIKGMGFEDRSLLYLKKKLEDKPAAPDLPAPREADVKSGPFGTKWHHKPAKVVCDEKTPTLATRVASYCVVEPAKGICRVAKESMGYIIFVGLISLAGYSCYNPSGVATLFKSCIPNISVSVEKPEIMK